LTKLKNFVIIYIEKEKKEECKVAKIGFTKLGLKPNNEVVNIEFNEQIVEVKQYLPIDEKIEIVTNVLELSHD
jgi:hypothetical protein